MSQYTKAPKALFVRFNFFSALYLSPLSLSLSAAPFENWTTAFCCTFEQLVKHRRERWCVLCTHYNVISGHTSGLMVTGCFRACVLVVGTLAYDIVVVRSKYNRRPDVFVFDTHLQSAWCTNVEYRTRACSYIFASHFAHKLVFIICSSWIEWEPLIPPAFFASRFS